jgi:hypothetical protein
MANPVLNQNPAGSENRTIQELSLPLYQARGWLKFLGILTIIGGVGQALSIVGIIFAWLPIWMGVLMYQAGTNIGNAGQFGDKFAFLKATSSLKTIFVIMGVITLLSLLLGLLAACLAVVLPLLGITLVDWNSIYNSVYNSINTFNSIY